MRIQNNWNFNTSLAEMQNGTVTLENGLAVSNKVNLVPTSWPSNCTTSMNAQYAKNWYGIFIKNTS